MFGLADGRKTKRKQCIGTPKVILRVCRDVWGEIALDPCADKRWSIGAAAEYRKRDDGLALPWMDHTFWNPPFCALKAWMAKAAAENVESIGIFPARTHRAWWWDYVNGCEAVAWLAPLAFRGYTQQYPAPLVLVYHGESPKRFARCVKARISTTKIWSPR
jgi:hypothetical protein